MYAEEHSMTIYTWQEKSEREIMDTTPLECNLPFNETRPYESPRHGKSGVNRAGIARPTVIGTGACCVWGKTEGGLAYISCVIFLSLA